MLERLVPTTAGAAAAYEATINVFTGLFREVKDLTKKKPDAAMSNFKVTQINRLLNDVRGFLKDEPEAKYLDLLDDETLPQMADAVVVMAQYEGALMGFRERHSRYDSTYGDSRWLIKKT